MRILATNDDGIYSPGLWAAVEALRDVGEVVVVAPDREQSGIGTAITLGQPVRATEVVPLVEGIKAYAVEGTPADSAILALESLVEGQVDLIVSGINKGANMGNDVFISGTIGAALQGFFRSIPAIAISVASLRDVHFAPAAQVVRLLAQGVADGRLATPLLLNVNLPNVPLEKIKGVSLTHLGRRTYMDVIKEGDDGRRKYFWIARDRPGWVLEKGLDVWAIRRRRISITPLHTDLTSNPTSRELRGLTRDIRQAFRPQ
ncbi:MAG: 5'/3'-nucleotidase SurE [Chloroflexi bacterium]|nr:5'/3'-nucleotidase SurE [Chloroflexota bacterium]